MFYTLLGFAGISEPEVILLFIFFKATQNLKLKLKIENLFIHTNQLQLLIIHVKK